MKRISLLVIIPLMLAVYGCSSSNDSAVTLTSTGKHPAGWVEIHGIEFSRNSTQCMSCHGSYKDPAASGGISGVSCFSATLNGITCHASGPGHPSGWEASDQHGRAGAMATPAANKGFAYCSNCHGDLYNDLPSRSCYTCHTKAPHPDKPWHGTTASGTNHVFPDPGNAPECAKCHTAGNNLTSPLLPSYATGAPGCFNATLCHGQDVGHPDGWEAPTQHGTTAKAAVSASAGFGYCRSCHGSGYTGAGAAVSCFSCHMTAPHSPKPWRGTLKHTSTDQSNAEFCGQCHRNGANLTSIAPPPLQPASTPSGCYNNTLCHGTAVIPPHVANASYLAGTAHGPDAKTNLASCQPCHATPASGSNPRFTVVKNNLPTGCETCHNAGTAHPTPWLPGRAGNPNPNTTTHATALALTTSCSLCHGAALTGGSGPSCMSASISGIRCHSSSPATNPTGCVSCHGQPPTGTAFPNTDNTHSEHHGFFATTNSACQACHNGHGMNFTTQIGTATHANGIADVTISTTYKAKPAGTPAITAGKSCTNISCHGGQTTPAWDETNAGNLINIDTDCVKCHEFGTAQYNSYNSGKHAFHVGEFGISCTDCHNTLTLSVNHFTRLDTPIMEGPASGTIGGGATFIPAGNWDPVAKSCVTAVCHGNSIAKFWLGI